MARRTKPSPLSTQVSFETTGLSANVDRDLRAIGADHAPVSSATSGAASGPEPDRRRTDKAES